MRGGGALVAGAVVGALTLAATGCSGSGDATETTVAPTAVATDPPATEPPDPTTAPAIASTTAAPATAAPTTTLDDEAATLAAVEQAYLDGHAAYLAAARNPGDIGALDLIVDFYTGPNLAGTQLRLDSFAERGIVSRQNDDQPSRAVILVKPRLRTDRTDVAELTACEVDSERLYEAGAAPDGSDALVNDEIVTERLLVRLQFTDGAWKSRSGELLEVLAGPNQCTR